MHRTQQHISLDLMSRQRDDVCHGGGLCAREGMRRILAVRRECVGVCAQGALFWARGDPSKPTTINTTNTATAGAAVTWQVCGIQVSS